MQSRGEGAGCCKVLASLLLLLFPTPPSPHPPLALQHHLIFPSFNLARPPSIPLLHRRAQPHYILQEIIAFVWKECGEEGKGARTGSLCGEKRGSLKDNWSLLPSPASSSSFACSSCFSPPFHLLLAQPASLPPSPLPSFSCNRSLPFKHPISLSPLLLSSSLPSSCLLSPPPFPLWTCGCHLSYVKPLRRTIKPGCPLQRMTHFS